MEKEEIQDWISKFHGKQKENKPKIFKDLFDFSKE